MDFQITEWRTSGDPGEPTCEAVVPYNTNEHGEHDEFGPCEEEAAYFIDLEANGCVLGAVLCAAHASLIGLVESEGPE